MDVLCACPASPSSDTPVPSLAAASSITAAATTTTTASDVPPSRARLEGGGSFSHVSEMAGCFICGLLTCVFAIVGLFIGAATGAFIGLSTESGLLRGAGIGAISGAIFSIDVAETSLTIWRSRGSGLCSILFLVDIIASLLSGRLVREKVGPAMQNAVRIQMSAVEAPSREAPDMFETGGTEGMPRASVERMARERITGENRVDSSGEKICCSVCLQDLQVGEIVRCLPHCRHKFHVHCIDAWLLRHGSCPLCRRDV